jgi:hypothetical protein
VDRARLDDSPDKLQWWTTADRRTILQWQRETIEMFSNNVATPLPLLYQARDAAMKVIESPNSNLQNLVTAQTGLELIEQRIRERTEEAAP